MKILDPSGKPIQLDGTAADVTTISSDGTITQNEKPLRAASVSFRMLRTISQCSAKVGGTLLSYPDMKTLKSSDSQIRSGFIEHANVDPATEMVHAL